MRTFPEDAIGYEAIVNQNDYYSLSKVPTQLYNVKCKIFIHLKKQ